jgi:hypothetical protein
MYTLQGTSKKYTFDILNKPAPWQSSTAYRMQPFNHFEQRTLFTLGNIIQVNKLSEPLETVKRRLEISCMKLRLHKKRFTYILCLKY